MILDSACGHPKTLCEIARAGLQFIVPLRAQSGFRERFLADVGPERLRALRYVSAREQRLPSKLRTKYRGALRDWEVSDPETGETRRFRVAYIHSSEEQEQVAAARERALTQGRGAAATRQERARRALLQDPQTGRDTRRQDHRHQHRRADHHHHRHPQRQTDTHLQAQPGRDRRDRSHRRDLRARDQPPPQTPDRRAGTTRLQRPADRRAPPPRLQTDTQSPPDLPPQRRPHLRAHQHHRDRSADLRTDRNRDPQSARRDRADPRPAAREPLSETHRTQRARRLPRTRPHLHPHRDRTRPTHPHPTPRPRTPPDHATLARATAGSANPFAAVAVGTPVARRPPRRSQRARLTHWAPALGDGGKSLLGPWMQDPGLR